MSSKIRDLEVIFIILWKDSNILSSVCVCVCEMRLKDWECYVSCVNHSYFNERIIHNCEY